LVASDTCLVDLVHPYFELISVYFIYFLAAASAIDLVVIYSNKYWHPGESAI
jgi:hypothetical protein